MPCVFLWQFLAIILQLPNFECVKFEVPIEFPNEKVKKEYDYIDWELTKSFGLEGIWTIF